MQVEEAALLEERVDRAGGHVAHAPDGADRVGARAQVGDLAQELEAVALLLERVVVADLTHDLDRRGPDLEALPLRGRLDQLAARDHRAAGPQVTDLVEVREPVARDDLDAAEAGAVRHVEERDLLRVPGRAQPAAHADRSARGRSREQIADARGLHAHSGAGPGKRSRRTRLRIFPVGLRGIASIGSITRGTLKRASFCSAKAISAAASSS